MKPRANYRISSRKLRRELHGPRRMDVVLRQRRRIQGFRGSERRLIVNTHGVGLQMILGWIRRICKTIIGRIEVDLLDSFVYDSRWMVVEWVSYNIIMIEGATMSGRFPQLSSVALLYDVMVDVFRRVINYSAVFGADDVHCDQRNIAATAKY